MPTPPEGATHGPARRRVLVLAAVLLLAGCGTPDGAPAAPPPAASPEPAVVTATPAAAPPAATPPIAAPSTAPASAGTVVYRADWSAGLDGWSGGEDWAASRGTLVCSGQHFVLTAGAVAPFEVGPDRDFAVEAELRLLRYEITNGSFGVMALVQDDGTGYALGHDEADGEIVLRAEKGGGRPRLDAQPFTADDGWHRFRLEVRGTALRGLVDGRPVLSATDTTFLTGRRVALWSNGAQLAVRGFTVSELTA